MSRAEQRDAEARRAAQAVWNKNQQRDADVLKDKEKARLAESQKIARLRELRLAAAASAARDAEAQAAPAPRRKKPVAVS
jgi:hypothetical protein